MPRVKINKDRCKGCQLCIVHCPKGMLRIDSDLNKLGFYPAFFSNNGENTCSGCRFCVLVCPDVCIEVIHND